MKFVYSEHIRNRLRLRGIDYGLPATIVQSATEHYFDSATQYFVATMACELYGRIREIMVAYTLEADWIKLITIHPLKEGQKENRIESGRWRRVDERF